MYAEINSGKELELSSMFNSNCGNCGGELFSEDFEFHPDSDGSTYRIKCEHCGQRYLASVSKVRIV